MVSVQGPAGQLHENKVLSVLRAPILSPVPDTHQKIESRQALVCGKVH